MALTRSRSTSNNVCNGRLTLETNNPHPTVNIISPTLFFTPYHGNSIALFEGGRWQQFGFAQTQMDLAGANANTNFDIFAFWNNGQLALERIPWQNSTARWAFPTVPSIEILNGVWVRSGEQNKRLIGSIRTTSAGFTVDSLTQRFVFNLSNRIPRKLLQAGSATYSYTTATFRPVNNLAIAQSAVEILNGDTFPSFPSIELTHALLAASSANTGHIAYASIGINSGTINGADLIGEGSGNSVLDPSTALAILRHTPSTGYSYYQALEVGGANMTMYNFYMLGSFVC